MSLSRDVGPLLPLDSDLDWSLYHWPLPLPQSSDSDWDPAVLGLQLADCRSEDFSASIILGASFLQYISFYCSSGEVWHTMRHQFTTSGTLVTLGNCCLKLLVAMPSEMANTCYYLQVYMVESGWESSQRSSPVIFLPLHTACLLCLRCPPPKRHVNMTTMEFTGRAAGNSSSSHKPALYKHQPITTLFSRPPANSQWLGLVLVY